MFGRWSHHSTQRFKDTLDGVPLEKFRRIRGVFDAVVPEEFKKKEANGSWENPIVAKFHEVEARIHSDIAKFNGFPPPKKRTPTQREEAERLADEIADQIHNLHLLLGILLPADALEYALIGYRDEYRAHVSADLYQEYKDSPTYKALINSQNQLEASARLDCLRSDYQHLINELRKLTLAEYHVEIARGNLMRAFTWTYLQLIVIPGAALVIVFVSGRYSDPILTSIALISGCAIAGATGALVSILLRIDAIPQNLTTARSLTVLRYSESIWVVPLTGLVFALLLTLLLAGQVLAGPLFPTIDVKAGDYFGQLRDPENIARFLGWSFIAGFAERLMPDVIDRLGQKAQKLDEKHSAI